MNVSEFARKAETEINKPFCETCKRNIYKLYITIDPNQRGVHIYTECRHDSGGMYSTDLHYLIEKIRFSTNDLMKEANDEITRRWRKGSGRDAGVALR